MLSGFKSNYFCCAYPAKSLEIAERTEIWGNAPPDLRGRCPANSSHNLNETDRLLSKMLLEWQIARDWTERLKQTQSSHRRHEGFDP